MESILKAVDFMNKHLDKGNIQAAARCIILQLYIPCNQTLLAAISAYYEDCEQSVTKELYVDVGRQLSVSKWKVEKDIRDAIRRAWVLRDRDDWKVYFPQENPPTNSEFLARIVDVLKLWQECSSGMVNIK